MRKDLFDKLLLNSVSANLLSGVVFHGYQIFAALFVQMRFYFRDNDSLYSFPPGKFDSMVML